MAQIEQQLEVAIIGAGITGLLIAQGLQKVRLYPESMATAATTT